jgi:catechol 2,3-dioxygenase-like lactoylglutathione lyase family enzyme
MPEIQGLRHAALTVRNLDASARWYMDVLGLEEAFSEPGEERRAVVLRLPDGGPVVLGLVQHGRDERPGFDPTVVGLDHLAFAVGSRGELDVWADHLIDRGVAHSGAIDVPPGAILNFKDPDGIALALFWERPTAPVLDGFNLVVSDMDASVAFYQRLGVNVLDTLPEWRGDHRNTAAPGGVAFDLDSEAFAQQWNQGWPGGRMGVLGFRVASREAVDSVYADLTGAGYKAQQPPYDAFWGARYAIVEDPDGNAIGLMSPLDPDHRGPAPSPPPS